MRLRTLVDIYISLYNLLMSQSFKLFRLQQIDSQCDKAHSRLQEIEAQIRNDRELKKADALLANAEAQTAQTERSLRKTEQDVKDQRIKIELTESSLYGGKIRNPRELQDLQNESAALKRYLAVLEDKQLESMIAVEEAEAELDTARKNQSMAHQHNEQRNAILLDEQEKLRQDIERLESERSATLVSIPDSDIKLYEQLRIQRSGLAVASIIDRTCSACGSTLSSALLNSAQLPNQISRCSRCNRILYAG